MSMRQTLDVVEAMLQDETVGLRARVESLAATLPGAPAGDPGPLSADFAFYRGNLPGALRPTTRGNVMLRPSRWVTNTRIGSDVREATSTIEIGFETFSASHNDNVDEATLVATALLQCLDGLRDFADLHEAQYGASIVDVAPDVDVSYGDFEGPTSYGFICRVSVQELSNDD